MKEKSNKRQFVEKYCGHPLFGDDELEEQLLDAIEKDGEDYWISVKDKWPPRHQNVWCLNKDGYMFEGRICFGMHEPFFTYPRGDGNASNTCPSWINVTHWRHLPRLPI